MKMGIVPMALLGMLLACPSATGQGQPPKAGPAAQTPPTRVSAPPTPSEKQRADTHADARVCLEFPNDLQIIACAEKYRRARGR
jgi:hypothetical protein